MLEQRTITGEGNNETNPDWGTPETQLGRLVPSAYADGVSAMITGRPEPRDISDVAVAQGDQDIPNSFGVNMFWAIWGQFLDHDLDLTTEESGEIVMVPRLMTPFHRSTFDPATGTDTDNPRQQVNDVTSFIDASMVYGSDEARADYLRSFEGGRLRVSEGDLLPYNNPADGFEMGGDTDPENPLFVAGDVRANENSILAAFHTLFLREHNYWADRFAEENPEWGDEDLYAQAKIMVEALIQKITYTEYLPLLLGENALPAYTGYNPAVDPSIVTEFSTAAFRFGHSTISSQVDRLNEDGSADEAGPLSVRDLFFNIEALETEGLSSLIRGLTSGHAQELDGMIIDDLRLALELPTGADNIDLAALNMLRGRDHGIPSFTEVRAALSDAFDLDLPPITDFSGITSDAEAAARLSQAYGGDVTKVDLWVGGLNEDKVPGSQFGPTFHAILSYQFAALRDGDRFWYQSRLDGDLLEEIEATRFSDIILRNTEIDHLQADAFLTVLRMAGTDEADKLIGDEDGNLIFGGDGRDKLKGEGGDDTLYGDAGKDKLKGGLGDDTLWGGAEKDILKGEDGDDTLYGGGTGDKLRGKLGNDTIFGEDGDDDVKGNKGDDVLSGGLGNDKLKGDAGADTFIYTAGNDKIKDFKPGEDVIVLENLDGFVFADLLAIVDERGSGFVIDFAGGGSLKVKDTDFSDLSADDFIFG